MVPAVSALLSLLSLKLLDKERRSHINDFNCDEGVGLFAGLNIPPKKSFATDYSYRTQRTHQQRLLSDWVAGLSALLFPQAQDFSVDFHPIPYRGDPTGLDTHYVAMQRKAGPSVLTFFAQGAIAPLPRVSPGFVWFFAHKGLQFRCSGSQHLEK